PYMSGHSPLEFLLQHLELNLKIIFSLYILIIHALLLDVRL
ncbi:MAG: hypothetical protein ACI9VM_000736, partial [Candidatus Azotimanducaceae bacterium]